MSWLTDLFQRKPGGTVMGNMLRGYASTLTDGKLGTGAGMITEKQADIRDMPESQFILKYGTTKTGVPVKDVIPNPNIKSADQFYNDAGNNMSPISMPAMLKSYVPWIVAGLAAILILPKLLKKAGW